MSELIKEWKINNSMGEYRKHIILYKNKIIKTGTFRNDKAYEVIITVNIGICCPQFRQIYAEKFKTKKEAMAIINPAKSWP
ncbi:MAG: hypothetical protein KKG99_12270 [Bacteroidetes bacterium]|nr:hypothetical protein [Bacteroidota bacterium]